MKSIYLCSLLFTLNVAGFCGIGLNQQVATKKLLTSYYGYNDGGFDPERMIFGGNLGLNFVKKGFEIYVAPTIGYRITNRFHLGINASYDYFQQKLPYKNGKTNEDEIYVYKASNYSTSLFARLFVLRSFFLMAEPEYNFYKILNEPEFTQDLSTGKAIENASRIKVPALLIGAGFAIPIGENAAFVLYGLYDVIQNPMSPHYGLPVIRGGFNVGMY